MPDPYVSDEEILYRRVPDKVGNYKCENGKWRVSSAAFGDRGKQVSVDRAKLHSGDPAKSKVSEEDFVAQLVTGHVRARAGVVSLGMITRTIHTINGKENVDCKVDVFADPLGKHCRILDRTEQPENPAHALIRGVPDFGENEDAVFKKVKKALARLSEWAIGPLDPC